MKTKLLYGAVLFSSAMLVACGGSSSSEPDKGKSNPIKDKGPSKVIDLTETNEGLYVAARFALDNSLFWEHFVGASPSKIEDADWDTSDEGHYFEPCIIDAPVIVTAQVFGESLAAYQCSEEMEFEDASNVKGTKATSTIKVGESQWLGYYSLSGDSDNTPHIYNDSVLSAKINAELFVKANDRANTYESRRTYFVDMKQTETFGEYVRGQTLKLGASREVPFEVFVRDGLYDIEGPISLALRQGSIECHFSIDSLETLEPPALDFKPIGEPLDPDELELVAVHGGELSLDNSIIAFDNDGKNATVNGASVDLDKVEALFNQCGWEDD